MLPIAIFYKLCFFTLVFVHIVYCCVNVATLLLW